uniref:Protein kinase domain-containing protein n=1 Tax=Ciona savignyi TaxID=51511 RepID=H2Y7F9_CIOSA
MQYDMNDGTPLRHGRVQTLINQTALQNSPSLQIPASPFMKHLGFGTGVNVYLIERSPRQGQYRSPWAVKKINRKCRGGETTYIERLKEEAAILKSLHHTNIVGFRSFTKSMDGTFCLAMENGEKSLFSMIEDRMATDFGPFPVNSILEVAAQVSSALQYLHEEKRILHGDLKSANVLVQGDFEIVRICDFGVTVRLNEKLEAADPNSQYVGTESWCSKDVMDGGVISDKADIYAYGMVLYEMLALTIPHMHVFPDEVDFSISEEFEREFEQAELEYQKSLGTRPPLLNYQYDIEYQPVIELFWACSQPLPEDRPSATQIVESLKQHTKIESCIAMPDPKGKLEF